MDAGPDAEQARGFLDALWCDLREGLSSHLPYAAVSMTLVVLSIPVGAVFVGSGSDLSGLPLSPFTSVVLPQERTAAELLGSDVDLFSLLVIGAATLGVLTVLGLVTQGLVAGYFISASLGDLGTGLLVVALIPHGLPKLVGLALAAAVSLRLVGAGIGWLVGFRGRFLDNREWRQTGLVLLCAFLSLALAALIEAHVTFRLIDVLF